MESRVAYSQGLAGNPIALYSIRSRSVVGKPMSASQQLLETSELDPRLSRYRFVMGGLLLLLNFSLGLSFFVVTPITPIIMEEFGINRSAASLLTSVVILSQAGLAIPSGIIVSRVEVKRMVLIGWALASAPMLTWMATGFPHSAWLSG